eukprot:jgi/Mesvir1/28966/Mv17741-RA.2
MQGPQDNLHVLPPAETEHRVGREVRFNEDSAHSSSPGEQARTDHEGATLRMHEIKNLREEILSIETASPASQTPGSPKVGARERETKSWLSLLASRGRQSGLNSSSTFSGVSRSANKSKLSSVRSDNAGAADRVGPLSPPKDLDKLFTSNPSDLASETEAGSEQNEENDNATSGKHFLWKTARGRWKAAQVLAESVNERALYGTKPPRPLKDIFQQQERAIAFCLDPRGVFRLYWDLIMAILIVYIALVVPFRTAFIHWRYMPWSATFIVELIMDIFFWLDILLNFHTPYLDESLGYFEYNKKAIRMNYLKSWFFVDLVSCLPVDYILIALEDRHDEDSGAVGSGRLARMLRVIRLLKLTKLLRLLRLRALMSRFEADMFLHLRSIHILKSFLLMLLMGHLLGCAFYLFSKPEYQAYWERRDTQKQLAWWWTVEGWNNATHNSMERNYSDIIYAERYICSIYWAFTTICTVGYGDISANTNAERIVSVFTMVLGGFVFSMLIGSMSSYFRESNAVVASISRKKELIHEYLRFRRFNRGFRQRVKDFYERLHKSSQAYDEPKILMELPLGLRMAIMEEMYSKVLRRLPLFHNQDRFFLARFCLGMRFTSALPGDLIMEAGDREHCMYLLFTGMLEVWRFLPSTGGDGPAPRAPEHLLGVLKAVSYFGEGGVLGYPYRTYSVKAANFCEIGVIQEDYITRLLADFPAARRHMVRCLRRRLRQWELEEEMMGDATSTRPPYDWSPLPEESGAGQSLGSGGSVFDVAPYTEGAQAQMPAKQNKQFYSDADALTAEVSGNAGASLFLSSVWAASHSRHPGPAAPPSSSGRDAAQPPPAAESKQTPAPEPSDSARIWSLPSRLIRAISNVVDPGGHAGEGSGDHKKHVSWFLPNNDHDGGGDDEQVLVNAKDLDHLPGGGDDDDNDRRGTAIQGVSKLPHGEGEGAPSRAGDGQDGPRDDSRGGSWDELLANGPRMYDLGPSSSWSHTSAAANGDLDLGVPPRNGDHPCDPFGAAYPPLEDDELDGSMGSRGFRRPWRHCLLTSGRLWRLSKRPCGSSCRS